MTENKATEYVNGLRALADMIEAEPHLAEILRGSLDCCSDEVSR